MSSSFKPLSHPTWVRGLKLRGDNRSVDEDKESHPTWVRGLKLWEKSTYYYQHHVAPYVGAWIETPILQPCRTLRRSHPTWVRGLKLFGIVLGDGSMKSHPTWVRGLKLADVIRTFEEVASHPTWVRGLKRT